jgi:hypothetical protein
MGPKAAEVAETGELVDGAAVDEAEGEQEEGGVLHRDPRRFVAQGGAQVHAQGGEEAARCHERERQAGHCEPLLVAPERQPSRSRAVRSRARRGTPRRHHHGTRLPAPALARARTWQHRGWPLSPFRPSPPPAGGTVLR